MATIVTVTLNPAVDRTLEVPNFRPGQTYKGTLRAFRAAGKGVNVSAVLAALGRPSVAVGFVGQHEQSLFRSSLHPALVDCRLAAVGGITRHHTTVIDPVRRTETHLREEGFRVNDLLVRDLKRSIGGVLRGGDYVVFAGSLPPGMDAARFADMVRHCTQVGARVVVDAEGPAMAAALGARLELIKPNVEELGDLVGRRLRDADDVVAAARSLLGKRLRAVLVSWGERGAYLVESEGVWHGAVRVPPDRFANSVGCGDALLAGFVAAQNEGLAAGESLKFAVACAAADAVTFAAGDVSPEAVEGFSRQVRVERWDEATGGAGAGAGRSRAHTGPRAVKPHRRPTAAQRGRQGRKG